MDIKRQSTGSYWGTGEHLQYRIMREGSQWLIDAFEVIETAGVKHSLGQPVLYFLRAREDKLARAKDAVRRYEADRSKSIIEHLSAIYTEETDAIRAEYDAYMAAR
jgi:hypothetical protein